MTMNNADDDVDDDDNNDDMSDPGWGDAGKP